MSPGEAVQGAPYKGKEDSAPRRHLGSNPVSSMSSPKERITVNSISQGERLGLHQRTC